MGSETVHAKRFNFEFGFDTFEKAAAGQGRERRVGGIVSTDDLDSQSERLIQEGLDFGPFLKGGWFNDNHAKTTGSAVGYPEKAELRHLPDGRKGWYVEGYLLKGHPPADEIWSMATALERSGAGRRLGFSVEGQILERDPANPSTISKAVVREVAITRCPVNDKTSLAVLAKSLAAGSAVSDPGAGPGVGFPLRTESLEGLSDEEKKKRKKRKMTKSEAIRLLMARHAQISEYSAARIVEHALRQKAALEDL